jgi:DUF1009 family protein
MKEELNIGKLGIIAGAGQLPKDVYEACLKRKIPCILIGIKGEKEDELFAGIESHDFEIHQIKAIIQYLKSQKVTHLTLAGKVTRRDVSRLLLDMKGAKLFARILRSGLNDNSILTTIIEFLEEEGFTIVAPEKLATNIVAQEGSLTKVKPDETALNDIDKGVKILQGIGKYDVGQALVIQNGLVLGVEAAEGTDELLMRCGAISQKDELAPILVKIMKPDQDARVDLPCIGPRTIEVAKQCKVRGIALDAGKVLIIDGKKTKELADKYGIFIYGYKIEE